MERQTKNFESGFQTWENSLTGCRQSFDLIKNDSIQTEFVEQVLEKNKIIFKFVHHNISFKNNRNKLV